MIMLLIIIVLIETIKLICYYNTDASLCLRITQGAISIKLNNKWEYKLVGV